MHNTRHKIGMINICTKQNGIVMGNGHEVSTTKMGYIKANICDMKVNQDFGDTLGNVAINQSGTFNLFSTSKLQRMVWKFRGDEKALWLTMDEKTIKFPIVVTTAKGLVFCSCLK